MGMSLVRGGDQPQIFIDKLVDAHLIRKTKTRETSRVMTSQRQRVGKEDGGSDKNAALAHASVLSEKHK